VSGSEDRTFRLWDITSGRVLKTVQDSYAVTSVVFSPDGRTVVSGGGMTNGVWVVKLWDIASGHQIKTFAGHSKQVSSVAFSPDGRTILAGSDDATIKLWDVSTGRVVKTLAGSFAFSPDGRTVLSENSDKTLTLWEVASGRALRTFTGRHYRVFRTAALSLDGSVVLSGIEDGTLKLREVGSGRLLLTFTGHSDAVISVALSPDGRTALSGSADTTLKLWDVATGREIRTFVGQTKRIASVAFSSDGRYALSGSGNLQPEHLKRKLSGLLDNTIALWDTVSGREIRIFVGHSNAVSSVAFSPNGRTALSGSYDTTVKLWDVSTGHEIRTLKGHSYEVTSVAFSPDGRSALSGSVDSAIKLWDVTSGREVRAFTGHIGWVKSVAFSPDGHTMLSGGADDKTKLWDVASGREIWTSSSSDYSPSIVSSVAFATDGHTALSASYDKSVKLLDIASGRVLRTLTRHPNAATSVTFSPDGRTALSGSHDNTIKLWEIATGREIRTFNGHSGSVESVEFSPDGRTVLSGSDDGSTRLWDVATGAERVKMISFRDDSWLTITPEGFFDASSPQAAQNLSIVRGLEVSSVDQVYNALYRPDLVREKLAGDPNGKVKAAAAQLNLDKVMASGAAPRVAITSPASGSSSATDEVAVEATIADQGGGIGKVEWRVNGVTLGLESRGLERLDAGVSGSSASGRTETMKRTLSLEPGDNRIEVLAYNTKGLIASEAAQVTIKWDGAKTATPPNLYVLAVGVNDYYDSRLRLTYAVPDATALAEGFRKAGNGLYAGVEVRTVLDSDVTLGNLDKVFAELSQKVKPRDVFVFFVAGHGKTKQGRYYFLPRDFRYEDETSIEKAGMGQDKFQAWFASISARKSLLLYDTCESGSLTGANARGSDVDERLGALNRMTRATGRTFLTATTDDAPALEGYRGHGVFTYALLDALGHADVNKNGLIEISEIADYIDQKVPDYSYEAFKLRQVPQRSIVGNNFALTNKAEVLAAASAFSKDDTATIPVKPTHVVVTSVDVKHAASDSALTVVRLAPGSQVRLMETANGWVLIARDGQKLGYVQENSIVGLQ
jgi:WD40 repeat protein/uncharacterized caspase-like protein